MKSWLGSLGFVGSLLLDLIVVIPKYLDWMIQSWLAYEILPIFNWIVYNPKKPANDQGFGHLLTLKSIIDAWIFFVSTFAT